MKSKCRETNQYGFSPIFAVVIALLVLAVGGQAIAQDVEIAQTSRLTGIALPGKTGRIINPETLSRLVQPLREMAAQSKAKVLTSEVLGWEKGTAQAAAEQQLSTTLKKNGFSYSAMSENAVTEAGTLRLFNVSKTQPKTVLLGYWLDNQEGLLLIWAHITSSSDEPSTRSKPSPAPRTGVASGNVKSGNIKSGNIKSGNAKPESARPGTGQPKGGAQVPSALLGKWGFTTISGTTYWDAQTGAYQESGTRGSQTYTFERNGRYKMFNYLKARTYGWETQALTWEEGTYTVDGDRLNLRPTSGRYQVMGNQSSSRNYKRSMTSSELQKNAGLRYWMLNTDERTGKPILMMGKSKDSMSRYQRGE